jgi:hypothetical protein
VDKNICFDGVEVSNMGIEVPPSAATFNANLNGDLEVDGVYYFKFTYYNINKMIESDPSPVSAEMTAGSGASTNGITITIPADATMDSQVTHVKVYRTTNGGSVYYYSGMVAYDGTETTYDDEVADAALSDVMGELNASETGNTNVRGVPPVCPYGKAHKNRIFLFGGYVYTTGTVTTTADPTVTGSGTSWTSGMKDFYFQVEGDTRKYVISSITDTTHLELTESYAGTPAAGSSYYIWSEDSILYYSYIDLNGNAEPESFPSTYWIQVSLNDGDKGTGLGEVYNQLLVCKKNHLYVLSGTSESDFAITPINSPVGCVSHWSIDNDELGNAIFASEKGVYITNGTDVTSITNETIQNIFTGENNPPWSIENSRLQYCHGVYDRLTKRYMLWVSSSGSTVTDKCLVYDFNKVDGIPIGWTVFSVRANCSAIIEDTNGSPQVWFGDTSGFACYFDETATNDGAGISTDETRRGTATATFNTTTLQDSTATFNTTDDGLKGCWVKILSGTGAGQERMIASNTATVLTLSTVWTTAPDATSVYAIGYIDAYRTTKVLDFQNLLDKTIERIRVVFKKITSATSLYIKRYENLTSTQAGNTKYVDLTLTTGEHQTRFERNKSKHHQIKVGVCDVDRPVTVYEMELEVSQHGKPSSTKEKTG